ncbi:MAG TPA: SMP-30/gluconolactonase/LRE family protein [Acidimicrobiales bacterium]|nr:SMP-30/gluconolactonase/LRE family protein [Acidimicrobiales bacterium]
MADRAFTTLAEGGGFFEGPRWHDGRWWVSDFYERTVTAIEPGGGREVVLTVEGQPSGLGWRPDGSLLVNSMKDRRVLRRAGDGTVEEVADLSGVAAVGGYLNDMVVDAAGRAYVGNFGFDLMGGEPLSDTALVRVDPDGSVTVAAEGLSFPNGTVITPDGSTLVVGETTGGRLTAFTVAGGGALVDRRVWAEVPGTSPDGCTLDAEGRIWAADALGNRLVRVAEGGEIVDEVPAPEGLGFYACMLGGDDGRTLLVCAAPDFFERNRSVAREAVLLTTTVDVGHAGLP